MDGHGASAAWRRTRRVTRWLITLAAGCASQSPQEHLDELSARVAKECGNIDVTCYTTPLDVEQACLQQALDGNVVARLSQRTRTTHGFFDTETMITADHVIWDISSASDEAGGYLWFEYSCSGPVIVSMRGTGCLEVGATSCR